MLRDLALDTVSHDLTLDVFDLSLVENTARVAQQIKVRLWFFLGEWFLDVRAGIPYYRDILIKKPERDVVEGIFRAEIEGTPNVRAVDQLALEFDSLTRQLIVTFVASTDFGVLEFNQLFEV